VIQALGDNLSLPAEFRKRLSALLKVPRACNVVTLKMAEQMNWRRCLHMGGTTTSGLDRIMRLGGRKKKLRRFLRRENQVLFKQCVLEDKLELKAGGEFTWKHANYSLLLPALVAASTELQEVFSIAAREHPCSEEEPWRLVVAMDEYSPGDKHKPKNLENAW
jgi:hypothetical protein